MSKHNLIELRKLYVARAFDLEQVKAYSAKRIVKKIDALLKVIVYTIRLIDPTGVADSTAAEQRLRVLFNEVDKLIKEAYDAMYKDMIVDAEELAEIEALFAKNSINKVADEDIITKSARITAITAFITSMVVQGATFKQSMNQQIAGFSNNFERIIRMGALRGEDLSQLMARTIGTQSAKALGLKGVIKGVTDVPIEGLTVDVGMSPKAKRNVEAIIRTGYQTVINNARQKIFDENSDVLRGYENLSVLDGRTTDICIAYSGARWDLSHNPIDGTTLPFWAPPRHWGCRSILIPLIKNFKELSQIIDIPEGKRSAFSQTGMVGQVPLATTFNEFMRSMSDKEQNSIIGKGKAELWRAGKIKLSDMLNPQNKSVLTLKELRKKTENM